VIACLDTGVLIRAVEGGSEKRATAIEIIRRVEGTPGGVVIASQLCRIECLVRPTRLKDAAMIQAFDDFFSRSGIVLVDVSNEILERALAIRAEFRLKMPDAISVATALVSKADVIVSADADIYQRGPFGDLRTERFPV
jgi:predicted nucleic acid-binding protein